MKIRIRRDPAHHHSRSSDLQHPELFLNPFRSSPEGSGFPLCSDKAFTRVAVVDYCKPWITTQMDASTSPDGGNPLEADIIFEKLKKKISGINGHLTTKGKILNNELFSLLIKRSLENFHEIFGPRTLSFMVK